MIFSQSGRGQQPTYFGFSLWWDNGGTFVASAPPKFEGLRRNVGRMLR